jgi:photosystem II stability/assembly factor-like uncharacterized protein
VTGVRGKPDTYYFGGVGGGVWRSDNSGRTWTPIFDQVPMASIGAIAVAPSDPNVIYVGTGEADMRSDIQQGDGMYKSTDAGKTWTHIGLADTRQIGKILVDPGDANIVYVAALGHQYGPNPERGVFKSVDGGHTWDKVLFKNADTGAIDLAMDPVDNGTLFAAMWQTRRPPWNVYPPSNGPGGGLYKSTDAGKTWTQVKGRGFPDEVGRMGLSVSPVDRDRVYAMVDTKDGGLYRSDDGGDTWTHVNKDPRTWGRGFYFEGITADPKDRDVIYTMNTSTYRSVDAGKTFIPIKGAPGGDDYHTLWINPDDPNRMILGCDQGVIVSVDGAKTWSSWYNQPTGQFYHVITDNRFPYWIYGAQQDSGAYAVPSRSIHSGISAMDARPIDVGGESGTIAPDPLHPGVLLGNNGSKEVLSTAWNQNNDPSALLPSISFRSTWTLPIAASPTEPHVFYMSHQQVFRSADDGLTWDIISPDLSRPSTPVPANLDAPTIADDNGDRRHGVVYWLAPSPVKAREIWAGTDDGLVWLTRDEGAHWQDVTPHELTPWSKVGIIDASHFDSETAYIAVDRHRLDDNRPYIYRTRDGGRHWRLINAGLPATQWVNVVREDPKQKGLLYAGTEWAVYVSFDDGDHWQSLQLDLPAASMRDIVFGGDDVVVGTHGRAMWALDDVALLRETARGHTGGTRIYRPSEAVLFQRAGTFGFGAFDEGTPLPPEEPQGENPAWGAIIDYYLDTPRTPVVFTFRDAAGKVIRRLSSADPAPAVELDRLDIPAYWVHLAGPPSGTKGAHRYAWNMRFGNDNGPLVPPGSYTVEMSANGFSYKQPLTIRRDPRIAASDADLKAQFELALAIREEIRIANDALAEANKIMRNRGASLSPLDNARLAGMVGGAPAGPRRRRPGPPPSGAGSLSRHATLLANLEGEIESAMSAPNPGLVKYFRQIRAELSADLAFIHKL